MLLIQICNQVRSFVGLAGLLVLLLNLTSTVLASGLDKPEGRIILRVSGDISVTNAGDEAHFDRSLLESLGMQTIRTTTHWTEGLVEFEGVAVRNLLKAVGAGSRDFRAVALNDYAADIQGLDFDKYPVLLALKMNGQYMPVREKGPIWLVLPQSDFPELDNSAMRFVWIWQLNGIKIR